MDSGSISPLSVGQPVPRSEDQRLITGGGAYVDDLTPSGTVHGYVLRSRFAHARIGAVRVAAAQAAPGVRCVLTAADCRAAGLGDLPVASGFQRPDGSPLYRPPYPVLADDRVRYLGDPVAFVVADLPTQAMDAAELIEVDYEPLPAVVETEAALLPGAPRVWDDCEDNLCFEQKMGDEAATDAAFAAADHVTRMRLVINRVTAVTMEPRACLGIYDAGRDHYTLHVGVQRAFGYRTQLARVLGTPEARLRIVTGDIGGSFGMKTPVFNEAPLVLLAARLTGRPVKWTSSRSESFLSDAHGRDKVVEAALALDADGRFLAVRMRVVGAVGAYLQAGMPNFCNNMNSVSGVYRTPAIFATVAGAFTNTNPVRAYRGNGRPEAAYVMERLVDLAADEIGIDPIDLRRLNLIPSSAMPFKTALAFTYDCGDFERCLDETLRLAEIEGFAARRAESETRGRLRGLGVSCSVERAGQGGEAAEIRVAPDGTVTLLVGSINHGQGHETIFKQILADKLGIPPRLVDYVQGDTEAVASGDGTGGSRTASVGGSAVHAAAEAIVSRAKAVAAPLLGMDPSLLDFRDGRVVSMHSNVSFTLAELANRAAGGAGLAAAAEYTAPAANFPNGCHVCEVEVDPETGATALVRYSVVDDVGTVLNPLLLDGQIHGGIAQGAGQILMEDICFDASGQLLSGSFMDYAMPRAADFPLIRTGSSPVPTRTNPLGAKGAGEAGTVGAMPAVANAIVDALSAFGVRHIEMPANPERVWRAIRQARMAGADTADGTMTELKEVR